MDLVNDCRSDVSPINISDSDSEYARLDLTMVKYALALVSSLQDFRFRRKTPAYCYPVDVMRTVRQHPGILCYLGAPGCGHSVNNSI